ncbi:MAG: glycosyltransferase [Chloroflexota bacterium]|nr:glycosyltransferase [Chloroflexota bacterium]
MVGPVYPYRGGIAHYTTMLYRALRNQGHNVLLVSFKRQYPQWLFPGRSDRDPSKKPLKVEGARYWIDSLNPLTWLTTFWRIRRYQPDAVILQWWTTFWAPVWFVLEMLNHLFLRRPLVIICHNVLPHEVRWWDPWLAKVVLRGSTRLIVQSVAEEKKLTALIPGAQVVVVPHPVYDMFADERISKEEARKWLGLPLDVPTLLFFGIVREYKGLQDILAALPEIRARLGRVILLVAGEFWEDKQPYLKMIERLDIGDSVVIEDRYIPNEEVPRYFSAADVLVAPYRRVTGSGVVQMAQGLGLPVITTGVSGKEPKATIDGKIGMVIPPEDPKSLTNAILRFFRVSYRTRLGNQTIRGEDQPSWSRMADIIADIGEPRDLSGRKAGD